MDVSKPTHRQPPCFQGSATLHARGACLQASNGSTPVVLNSDACVTCRLLSSRRVLVGNVQVAAFTLFLVSVLVADLRSPTVPRSSTCVDALPAWMSIGPLRTHPILDVVGWKAGAEGCASLRSAGATEA